MYGLFLMAYICFLSKCWISLPLFIHFCSRASFRLDWRCDLQIWTPNCGLHQHHSNILFLFTFFAVLWYRHMYKHTYINHSWYKHWHFSLTLNFLMMLLNWKAFLSWLFCMCCTASDIWSFILVAISIIEEAI